MLTWCSGPPGPTWMLKWKFSTALFAGLPTAKTSGLLQNPLRMSWVRTVPSCETCVMVCWCGPTAPAVPAVSSVTPAAMPIAADAARNPLPRLLFVMVPLLLLCMPAVDPDRHPLSMRDGRVRVIRGEHGARGHGLAPLTAAALASGWSGRRRRWRLPTTPGRRRDGQDLRVGGVDET